MEYDITKLNEQDEQLHTTKKIIGLIINGTEYPGRLIPDFTDSDGNQLTVELPIQKNSVNTTIYIEKERPEYEEWVADDLSEFEAAVNEKTLEIDTSQLDKP